jgi:hypothetical protein
MAIFVQEDVVKVKRTETRWIKIKDCLALAI